MSKRALVPKEALWFEYIEQTVELADDKITWLVGETVPCLLCWAPSLVYNSLEGFSAWFPIKDLKPLTESARLALDSICQMELNERKQR